MIRQRPQPTPGIIKVKASGELPHEEFNNILAFIKVAVGSQGKCRLLIAHPDLSVVDLRGHSRTTST
jgi:hypothetical protein